MLDVQDVQRKCVQVLMSKNWISNYLEVIIIPHLQKGLLSHRNKFCTTFKAWIHVYVHKGSIKTWTNSLLSSWGGAQVLASSIMQGSGYSWHHLRNWTYYFHGFWHKSLPRTWVAMEGDRERQGDALGKEGVRMGKDKDGVAILGVGQG